MIKVKNILKRDNLMSAAGLGVGSIAAEVVTNKVTPMVLKSEMAQKFAPAVPILAGMLIQTGTGLVKSIGHGMIANGVAAAVKTYLPTGIKDTFMITGNEDVMINGADTLMGYSSDSYDFTSGDAGEMNY